MSTRCEISDLLVDECGASCCRPDLVEVKPLAVVIEGTWVEAKHPGQCRHCHGFFGVGDDIVKAELEDESQGWCHVECTRSPNGGLA